VITYRVRVQRQHKTVGQGRLARQVWRDLGATVDSVAEYQDLTRHQAAAAISRALHDPVRGFTSTYVLERP